MSPSFLRSRHAPKRPNKPPTPVRGKSPRRAVPLPIEHGPLTRTSLGRTHAQIDALPRRLRTLRRDLLDLLPDQYEHCDEVVRYVVVEQAKKRPPNGIAHHRYLNHQRQIRCPPQLGDTSRALPDPS